MEFKASQLTVMTQQSENWKENEKDGASVKPNNKFSLVKKKKD